MNEPTVSFSPNYDHLKPYLRSFDPKRVAGIGGLERRKIDIARIRHAELVVELKLLEEQHDIAGNRHLQDHFERRMESVRVRIQQEFNVISPYLLR